MVSKHFYGIHYVLFLIYSQVYPDHVWNINAPLSKRKYLAYRLLHEKIFPNEDIRMDYIHPYHRHQDTSMRMHLDIYLPQLKLAFEYKVVSGSF